MKHLLYVLMLCGLISCGSRIDRTELTQLSGYWEIESVETADGVQREFSINTTIDYFELQELSGTRTKLQPQLDGRFKNNPTVESFHIVDSIGRWYLYYQTPYDNWVEQLVLLEADRLILSIPEGNTYKYKRYQALDLQP